MQFSVSDLIKVLGKTYQTIDIRTVATGEADSWTTALTIVRLTYEGQSLAEKRLQDLRRRHRAVETKHLRIFADLRPFSEWGELSSEAETRGVVRLCGVQINLNQRLSLGEQKAYLQPDYSEIRPFDGCYWPAAQVRIGRHEMASLSEDRFTREISPLGYSDAFEAANALCEVNVEQGRALGYDFYLSVPVFATVSEVYVRPSERKAEVRIRRHADLSDVTCVVCLRQQNYLAGQPFREQTLIPTFVKAGIDSQVQDAIGSAEFGEMQEDDWVQARLLHPEIGEIRRFESSARMLIQPAERNILLEALKLFCKEADFEDLLVRAYEKKAPRLTESASFELHVAWLLGLFGLSTVILGEYEHIVAKNTKVRRASVDVLAASQHRKLLIPVACSLNPPKAEDFANLRYARDILTRDVFQGTAVRVLPVLFTAATGCPTYDGAEGSLDYIPIFDADQMKNVLALLRTGEESRFFEFIGNPNFCHLGDYPQP